MGFFRATCPQRFTACGSPRVHADTRMSRSYFHLHLVSDATGETLIAASRAAFRALSGCFGDRARLSLGADARHSACHGEIEREPGIVLYTLVDTDISGELEEQCRTLGCPRSPYSSRSPISSAPISGPRLRPAQAPTRAQRRLFQAHRRPELHYDA